MSALRDQIILDSFVTLVDYFLQFLSKCNKNSRSKATLEYLMCEVKMSRTNFN